MAHGRASERPRHARPLRWPGPVLASVFGLVAWALIAHSSGSGWVQAVGALIGALLLVGLLAPRFALHGATVRCTWAPSDAVAGEPLILTVTSDRPVRIVPKLPSGLAAVAGGRAAGERTLDVIVVPDRRGLLDRVRVEVATSAPFGLLFWGREVDVPLPVVVHVSPRRGVARPDDRAIAPQRGDSWARADASSGEPRGVRPYRSGDPRHAVHWPATAHSRELMVRQWEHPLAEPVVVEVVLPPGPLQAEAEAERAMATVHELLCAHAEVLLITTEASGKVRQAVRTERELGRRMARTVTPVVHPPRRRSTDPQTPIAPRTPIAPQTPIAKGS